MLWVKDDLRTGRGPEDTRIFSACMDFTMVLPTRFGVLSADVRANPLVDMGPVTLLGVSH